LYFIGLAEIELAGAGVEIGTKFYVYIDLFLQSFQIKKK
jgi:hypothetical protein